MRIGSGLFLLGILTLVQFRELPSAWIALVLPVLALLSLRIRLFRYLLCYVSGLVWMLLVSHNILSQQLEADLENEEVTVQGHVSSLPVDRGLSLQFDFIVSTLTDQSGLSHPLPGKTRLSWYRPYPQVLPGEKLELVVKLKRPRGYMNPGGFDYEASLFQQRIRATGYVRRNNTTQPQRKFSIHSIRHYWQEKLANVLVETPVSGLIPALTIGDRSQMDNSQWQVLAATGTSHLLAISGLHIGLIAGFAFFLARWLWPLWSRGACWLPAQKVAGAISLLAAAMYAMLAGFTIPTQRALVMISVVILFGFLYKRLSSGQVFALALLSVLIIDPLAVLSGGFWLSFTAVFVILIALNVRLTSSNTIHNRLIQWGRLQFYVYAGLMPLLVILFNQLPLFSLIANSIAIPWVTLICIPIIMSGMPLLLVYEPAGEVILNAGSNALGILWMFLQYIAEIDIAQLSLPQPSLLAIVAACIGLGLLFMPTGLPGKWLGILCLLPLFLPESESLDNGEFEVTVLDVGQGLAAVINTRQHLLLYDTGPGFSSGFNAGWSVIVPYLKNAGHRRIDMIVVSHGDSDHIGGLADILKLMKVGSILTSVPEKIDFAETSSCISGQQWRWDDIDFEILSPDVADGLSGNNASCVLKISNHSSSVLMSGDIERRAEMLLLQGNTEKLDVDILLAPHHGSATSSTSAFIAATSPEYVIFPTGYLNRFGFPKPDIIERYTLYDTKMLNTAHDGAISIQFGNNKRHIVTERKKSLRYWHNDH